MKTPNLNERELATVAAQPITAEAVAAWLVAQTAALNLPGAKINVYTSSIFPGTARWLVECSDVPLVGGDTFDEAVATLRASIKSPAELAAEKRAAAQKLLDEAASIEASVTVAQEGAAA